MPEVPEEEAFLHPPEREVDPKRCTLRQALPEDTQGSGSWVYPPEAAVGPTKATLVSKGRLRFHVTLGEGERGKAPHLRPTDAMLGPTTKTLNFRSLLTPYDINPVQSVN